MRKFIYRENIKHFSQLLDRTADEAERERIMKLLAEEVAKDLEEPAHKQSKAV